MLDTFQLLLILLNKNKEQMENNARPSTTPNTLNMN